MEVHAQLEWNRQAAETWLVPPLAQVHTCIAHANIWSLSSVRITLLYLCRAGESNVQMLVSAPTLANRPLLAAVRIAWY